MFSSTRSAKTDSVIETLETAVSSVCNAGGDEEKKIWDAKIEVLKELGQR